MWVGEHVCGWMGEWLSVCFLCSCEFCVEAKPAKLLCTTRALTTEREFYTTQSTKVVTSVAQLLHVPTNSIFNVLNTHRHIHYAHTHTWCFLPA